MPAVPDTSVIRLRIKAGSENMSPLSGSVLLRDLVAAVCATILSASARQTPFRGATDIVPVYATVRGADGHLITDLQQEDFEILERGTPVPIAVFSNAPQPITLAILVDMSGGMFDAVRYPSSETP